jgi:hypothetical protein
MPVNLYQRSAMAAAIAACFPGAALAAGVAQVDFASGSVSATAPNGQSRALQRGSEIQVGETITTQQGRAQLRFADGAYMSLQPQTEFKVEEFKFAGGKGDASDSIVMNLVRGGLRTITGLIGRNNRQSYRLKTDVATIGIRGTEYSVKYTNSIELSCADGAVSVDNQSGSFVVTGGSTVMVSNQNTAPQTTDQKPVLPPESPAQQQEQQQQQKVADPVNPIQEASPVIIPRLVGTITGNWAAAQYEGGTYSFIDQKIVLNGDGALTELNVDSGEGIIYPTLVGTAQTQVVGNDGVMAWGRWIAGTTSGSGPFANSDLNVDGPLNWVVGLPATSMPTTGLATYNMIGYAASCAGNGCGGLNVTSSQVMVDFANYNWNYSMAFNITGGGAAGDWTFQSESFGALNGARLEMINGQVIPQSGQAGGGWMDAAGFLAGPGASHAGVAWQGYMYVNDFQTTFQGVTAHKLLSVAASAPPPQ